MFEEGKFYKHNNGDFIQVHGAHMTPEVIAKMAKRVEDMAAGRTPEPIVCNMIACVLKPDGYHDYITVDESYKRQEWVEITEDEWNERISETVE